MGISHKSKICLAHGSLANPSRGIRGRIARMENLWTVWSRLSDTRIRLGCAWHHASARAPARIHVDVYTETQRRKPSRAGTRTILAGDHNQLAHASCIWPLALTRVAVSTTFVCAPPAGVTDSNARALTGRCIMLHIKRDSCIKKWRMQHVEYYRRDFSRLLSPKRAHEKHVRFQSIRHVDQKSFTVLERSIIIQGMECWWSETVKLHWNGQTSYSLPRVAENCRVPLGCARERDRERERGGGRGRIRYRFDGILGDRFFCNTFEGHIELDLLLPRDHLCQVRAIMNEFWIVTNMFFEASTISHLHIGRCSIYNVFPPVSTLRDNVWAKCFSPRDIKSRC